MKLFRRQVKQELLARNATLMRAIIAGFLAWITTALLRVILLVKRSAHHLRLAGRGHSGVSLLGRAVPLKRGTSRCPWA